MSTNDDFQSQCDFYRNGQTTLTTKIYNVDDTNYILDVTVTPLSQRTIHSRQVRLSFHRQLSYSCQRWSPNYRVFADDFNLSVNWLQHCPRFNSAQVMPLKYSVPHSQVSQPASYEKVRKLTFGYKPS